MIHYKIREGIVRPPFDKKLSVVNCFSAFIRVDEKLNPVLAIRNIFSNLIKYFIANDPEGIKTRARYGKLKNALTIGEILIFFIPVLLLSRRTKAFRFHTGLALKRAGYPVSACRGSMIATRNNNPVIKIAFLFFKDS